MAKRKTSRQVAASRRNIKKAQMASARKRRGSAKAKPKQSRTRKALRYGITAAYVGAVGYAVGKGVRDVRRVRKVESAKRRKIKHDMEYDLHVINLKLGGRHKTRRVKSTRGQYELTR